MEALLAGETLGYDARGHRRLLITVGGTDIVLVIDDVAKLVLTLWVR